MSFSIDGLANYIDYFRSVAELHTQVKHFEHGPSERILEISRSEIDYPLFWLETPALKYSESEGENVMGTRVGAFVVAAQAKTDDPADQDAAWQLTEEISQDFLSRLFRDRRKHNFRVNFRDIIAEPISPLWVDNLYGWRVEFTLMNSVNLCYNFSKWNDQ